MAPQENSEGDPKLPAQQSLYIIRHGDRWDYSFPEVSTGRKSVENQFQL